VISHSSSKEASRISATGVAFGEVPNLEHLPVGNDITQ
jgi:hypothetical protein